ncbi:hypothetical protein [aff. Roholtiella sp. LEGE 12411]|uniref:hypothetical protein n=1 Tax=aff. Roholtiella sp. LEGE 12411 TaxID=1828822 RepID=UPI0018811A36|nr:hypothetical protein [aff. Roholtiella sp. LEGE 12411]MBE9034417.1 hypothetical protein [aff. Roholtiella sp. LEGE 12411]
MQASQASQWSASPVLVQKAEGNPGFFFQPHQIALLLTHTRLYQAIHELRHGSVSPSTHVQRMQG